MKKIFLFFVLTLGGIPHCFSQNTYREKLPFVFEQLKEATALHTALWDTDLYGNLLFVVPQSRTVYANALDSKGILKGQEGIYTGILPPEVNIANTSVEWGGKVWAMVMLPLPEDSKECIALLAHERFHTIQPQLHFTSQEGDNAHLDSEKGRIYLRLEVEALKKSLLAPMEQEQKEHLGHALAFRKYRHLLFPQAAENEHLLECNEGLAEYTGLTVAGLLKESIVKNTFLTRIEAFEQNPSFVRSFAYLTLPIYGYWASKEKEYWNKEITSQTNLTDMFAKLFHISLPMNLFYFVDLWAKEYSGTTIAEQERARAEKKQQALASYREKFVTAPHLVLPLKEMQISFDPRSLIPLEGWGTVYPELHLNDVWGKLTVTEGALISNDWGTVTVEAPLEINKNIVRGNGWQLTLKEGYTLIKQGNNYTIQP